MRSVLLGAVESTRVALERLAAHSSPPDLLLTLSPKPGSARHSDYCDLRPPCAKLGVEVRNAPESPEEFAEALASRAIDVLWVIGWSRLLPASVLEVPKRGAVAFHPSLLPLHRGRAVIPWTILLGVPRTGATLFWMDAGMDSGDILGQVAFDVEPAETATTLYAKHLRALQGLLDEAIPALTQGTARRSPQDTSRATYCAKRTPEDGWIDWTRPAKEIWTLIRATTRPYPGAFTQLRGTKVVFWAADFVPSAPYHGLPGQVVAREGGRLLISCADGQFLDVSEYAADGGVEIPLHARLGQGPGVDMDRT